MTATEATTLADILDRNFEQFADLYTAMLDQDGGLEDVIHVLRAFKDIP